MEKMMSIVRLLVEILMTPYTEIRRYIRLAAAADRVIQAPRGAHVRSAGVGAADNVHPGFNPTTGMPFTARGSMVDVGGNAYGDFI